MAFLESLLKGFVRSAVNQVGRDGGKVISNTLYKGGHSTPIGTPEYYRKNYQDLSPIPKTSNVLWNVIMFGVWTLLIPNSLITSIGVLAFFIPLPFVGRLRRPLFNSYVNPKVSKAIYKSDKRFTSGARPIGSYSAVDKGIKVPLEQSEIVTYRIEGIIKLAILLVSYGLMYSTSQTDKFMLLNMNDEEKITLMQKGDTLYKNDKFIYYYSLINDKIPKFQKAGYDTIGTSVIFLKVDSLQTNKDSRTEMEKVEGSPEFKAFKPSYDIMFEVQPMVKPILIRNEKSNRKNRKITKWYLNPSDINIGEGKLRIKK